MMLVSKRALSPLLEDLAGAADACASLAGRYRDAPMAGRTLLQQALPITFGLKAAGWLVGLDEVRGELAVVRDGGLVLQLGGAVGTLASLGEQAGEVSARLARELELSEPALPWHTIRTRPVRLACALGAAAGVMGKLARDVALLAQTEVAEVAEGGDPGRGGSSTMPHKRNRVSWPRCWPPCRRSTSAPRGPGRPNGRRCPIFFASRARRPRPCTSCSKGSSPTRTACARTSTSPAGC
jgi:3-carboxy-cis,cis-muconate cycloisomerase